MARQATILIWQGHCATFQGSGFLSQNCQNIILLFHPSTAVSKKKKKKKKLQDEQREFADVMRGFLLRPKVMLGMVMLIGLSTLLPIISQLLPELKQREEYRVAALDIQITEPPRWVPIDLVAEVIDRSELPEELSLLDSEITSQVGAAFGEHPWVRSVRHVEKKAARDEKTDEDISTLTIDLEYRRPVAMVRMPHGLYAVDSDGFLLPSEDFAVGDTKRFPLIINIQRPPVGQAGEFWGDVAVLGAARIAEAITPYWRAFDLTAIRIRNAEKRVEHPSDVIFELMTKEGSFIVWGRAPGTRHPGELSVAQKIGRLQRYLEDFGAFDKPNGPYEIDIRHWQEIARRPIPSSIRFSDRTSRPRN